MNLGDECQKFLIFIALAITVDEGWATKIQLIIPTKFINSNEGGLNQAVFSTWRKSRDKTLNILRMKIAFKVK